MGESLQKVKNFFQLFFQLFFREGFVNLNSPLGDRKLAAGHKPCSQNDEENAKRELGDPFETTH
jgi:hypothetical protein